MNNDWHFGSLDGRELTFAEYAGLLRCNFDGHGEKGLRRYSGFLFQV